MHTYPYARFTHHDRNARAAEHRRVAYDVGPEADAFRERRPPGWEEAAAAIETDGYYYPQKV